MGSRSSFFVLTQNVRSWVSGAGSVYGRFSPARTGHKVNAQHAIGWMNSGAVCGFHATVIINVAEDAAAPSGPEITEISVPLTFPWLILGLLLFLAMAKMNISNTGTGKHILPPKRGNEVSGYISALALSEQRESPLLSLRPGCYLPLTVPRL